MNTAACGCPPTAMFMDAESRSAWRLRDAPARPAKPVFVDDACGAGATCGAAPPQTAMGAGVAASPHILEAVLARSEDRSPPPSSGSAREPKLLRRRGPRLKPKLPTVLRFGEPQRVRLSLAERHPGEAAFSLGFWPDQGTGVAAPSVIPPGFCRACRVSRRPWPSPGCRSRGGFVSRPRLAQSLPKERPLRP